MKLDQNILIVVGVIIVSLVAIFILGKDSADIAEKTIIGLLGALSGAGLANLTK